MHHTTLNYSVRVIGPSQRPLPNNTQHLQDRHPCPQLASNTQSQQASARRPTPEPAQPPGSALYIAQLIYNLRTERGGLSALGNCCFTPGEAPCPQDPVE